MNRMIAMNDEVASASTSTSAPESESGLSRAVMPILIFGGLLVVAVVVGVLVTQGPGGPSGPLPVIAEVPEFSFTERSGETVTRDDMRGRIWVADFFFTSCSGPCPEMSLRMRSLHQAILSEGLPVTLVSVSIDPEYDRPAVLRRYADKYGADAKRWLFLTGEDQETVHELVKKGFLIAVEKATDTTPLVHSTYFLLIDQAGRIRAVYEGLEPGTKKRVLADVRRLMAEDAGA